MPIRKTAGFLLLFCMIFFPAVNISAATENVEEDDYINPITVDRVFAVDVSTGMFAGVNSAFYFDLPDVWNGYVDVDRVNLEPGGDILEKYNFYCKSSSGLFRHQPLMTLIVFDITKWRDNLYPLAVVLKTTDYVFAAEMGEKDTFRMESDIAVFNMCYQAISSIEQIKKCIILPEGQEEEEYFTVTVNGEKMASGVEIMDGIYYIALREVCEAFGYTITWIEDERAVVIEIKGDFIDKIFIDGELTAYAPNINVRIINDRVYVPMAYFMRVLRKNVEADERGNVTVTSQLSAR